MTTALRPRDHASRFGQPMTDEEWESLAEDDEGELVDGILVEEEMSDFVHGAIVA